MSTESRQKRIHGAAIVAAAAGSAALARAGRARLLSSGATDAEIADSQPGDDLIADADVTATRAITIRRSPEVVWPWIVQLGRDEPEDAHRDPRPSGGRVSVPRGRTWRAQGASRCR